MTLNREVEIDLLHLPNRTPPRLPPIPWSLYLEGLDAGKQDRMAVHNGWIPVAVRLPETDECYLVWRTDADPPTFTIAFFAEGRWESPYTSALMTVTHWYKANRLRAETPVVLSLVS
jgi:hypothetical protein